MCVRPGGGVDEVGGLRGLRGGGVGRGEVAWGRCETLGDFVGGLREGCVGVRHVSFQCCVRCPGYFLLRVRAVVRQGNGEAGQW